MLPSVEIETLRTSFEVYPTCTPMETRIPFTLLDILEMYFFNLNLYLLEKNSFKKN